MNNEMKIHYPTGLLGIVDVPFGFSILSPLKSSFFVQGTGVYPIQDTVPADRGTIEVLFTVGAEGRYESLSRIPRRRLA